MMGEGAKDKTPVLLLKTKSVPNDGYEEQFDAVKEGRQFGPVFVPVLEHQLLEEGLKVVKESLQNKEIGRQTGAKYGGLIFTSQRAVEAFAKLVEEGKGTFLASHSITSTPSNNPFYR
jgi:uroporphyrinogen-III synthase